MKHLFRTVLSLAGLALVSCNSVSQVSLDYQPRIGHVLAGPAEFNTQTFLDRRDVPPLHLGTVRTQLGTPVEHIQTKIPVHQVVTHAFGYGLQTRGMLTAPRNARYVISGEVLDLHCKLLVHPYGYARVRVTVTDASTGQILHSQVYEAERQAPAYRPGSGSPVAQLRDLASAALQDVVDRALDDPTLRNRLAPPASERPRWEPGAI
jgi:hypothetical protein